MLVLPVFCVSLWSFNQWWFIWGNLFWRSQRKLLFTDLSTALVTVTLRSAPRAVVYSSLPLRADSFFYLNVFFLLEETTHDEREGEREKMHRLKLCPWMPQCAMHAWQCLCSIWAVPRIERFVPLHRREAWGKASKPLTDRKPWGWSFVSFFLPHLGASLPMLTRE